LIEGENFVSLPVNKIATAQEFIEKFALYDGSIKRIATYDGPWGPGWGSADGSKFDTFSEIETHRGYIVVVDKVWTYDIEPPEVFIKTIHLGKQNNEININILFCHASDNVTAYTNLKYSVFITTDKGSCLLDLDKREPTANEICNVQKVISEQVPNGVWDEFVRGETLQYYYDDNIIIADISGLIPVTEYYFTVVVQDENLNKTQYEISNVETNIID